MNPVSYPPAPQPPASPPTSHGVDPLPVQRASQLESNGPQTQWLIEELWAEQAVGILGGEPKCCKSFLALDVAVSVASGAACLRQFPVRRRGPVLLFPAEDSLTVVRQRLEGIAAAAQVPFDSLPVQVITAPSLRLDRAPDRESLWHTVQQQRPVLLILDPLKRVRIFGHDDDAGRLAVERWAKQLESVGVDADSYARVERMLP